MVDVHSLAMDLAKADIHWLIVWGLPMSFDTSVRDLERPDCTTLTGGPCNNDPNVAIKMDDSIKFNFGSVREVRVSLTTFSGLAFFMGFSYQGNQVHWWYK